LIEVKTSIASMKIGSAAQAKVSGYRWLLRCVNSRAQAGFNGQASDRRVCRTDRGS